MVNRLQQPRPQLGMHAKRRVDDLRGNAILRHGGVVAKNELNLGGS